MNDKGLSCAYGVPPPELILPGASQFLAVDQQRLGEALLVHLNSYEGQVNVGWPPKCASSSSTWRRLSRSVPSSIRSQAKTVAACSVVEISTLKSASLL